MGLTEIFLIVTQILGGCLTLILVSAGIVCVMKALMSIADENPVAFKTIIKIISVYEFLMGLILFFRDIPIIYSFLTLWATLLLFNFISISRSYQAVAFSIISLIMWMYREIRYSSGFLDFTGELITYCFVPSVFLIVMQSRGSEALGGTNHVIPLRKIIGRIGAFVSKLIPPE